MIANIISYVIYFLEENNALAMKGIRYNEI